MLNKPEPLSPHFPKFQLTLEGNRFNEGLRFQQLQISFHIPSLELPLLPHTAPARGEPITAHGGVSGYELFQLRPRILPKHRATPAGEPSDSPTISRELKKEDVWAYLSFTLVDH